MTTPQMQLLSIRLDALEADIAKVAGVLTDARRRSELTDRLSAVLSKQPVVTGAGDVPSAWLQLGRLNSQWLALDNALTYQLSAAKTAIDREHPALLTRIDESFAALRASLEVAVDVVGTLHKQVVRVEDDRARLLETSLKARCAAATAEVDAIRAQLVAVEPTGLGHQRSLWGQYETLLELRVRPLFGEYVDFLSGLTVRDTALDRGVCQMTDTLLAGFTDLIDGWSVPGRRASLSPVMGNVVKLGFPEWTSWAVPLAVREIGLALADDRNKPKTQELLDRYVLLGRSRGEVRHLFADAFATLMAGPSYACAAILLRLQPHHELTQSGARAARLRELLETLRAQQLGDVQTLTGLLEALVDTGDEEARNQALYEALASAREREEPADVHRARLCLRLLRDQDPASQSSFGETVERLATLWEEAVVNLAPPAQSAEVRSAVQGARPEDDWLDDFVADARALVLADYPTRVFDLRAWTSTSDGWCVLLQGRQDGEVYETWQQVVELLNAAWRLRLAQQGSFEDVAGRLDAVWGRRRPKEEQALT